MIDYDDQILGGELSPIVPVDEEAINEHGEEVILVGAPRVWLTTEKESPVYLTKEDILKLGFLRSNPERKIYSHKDKKNLFLMQVIYYNYGAKDFMEEHTDVYVRNNTDIELLYSSTKPNKEDIQQVIDNYAA